MIKEMGDEPLVITSGSWENDRMLAVHDVAIASFDSISACMKWMKKYGKKYTIEGEINGCIY